MRWRAAAVLAVIGIAAIPGVSDALEPGGISSLHVSVKPASTVSCAPGKACPQIVVPPQMVGRFTFRVTRG